MNGEFNRDQLWSDYWSDGGSLMSMGGKEFFESPLANFWNSILAPFPSGSRVLDLCSGNGVLSYLALTKGFLSVLSIDSVDVARVNPAWVYSTDIELQKRLRFFGHADAENLPSQFHDYDLVVSQFGVEYLDWGIFSKSFKRYVSQNGRFAFVIHAKDSIIYEKCTADSDYLKHLLSTDFFKLSTKMCEYMAEAKTEDGKKALGANSEAVEVRSMFNACIKNITSEDVAKRSLVANEVAQLVLTILNNASKHGNKSLAEKEIQNIVKRYEYMQARLRELSRCALSIDEVSNMMRDIGNVERLEFLKTAEGRNICIAVLGTATNLVPVK